MTTVRNHVFVHLLYGMDVRSYQDRYSNGLEPDVSPYGFHLAERMGFDLKYSSERKGHYYNAVRRRLIDFMGFDILHAISNAQDIRKSDVIWTMTEGEAFAVGLMIGLKIIKKKPVIANAVWVFDKWESYSFIKKAIIKYSTLNLTILTVHSKKCLPVAARVFPKLKVRFQPFGINTDMFSISPPMYRERGRVIEVLSIGNDETRDWATLLAALGNDNRFAVRVICWRLSDEQMSPYKNVEAIRSPSMARFLEEYDKADVVVITMKDNIFSGITVALEAVALGKPVLASRTGGLSSYFEEDEIKYFNTNDPVALSEAILSASPTELLNCAIKAQNRFISEDYSTKSLIQSYIRLTKSITI